MTRFDRLRTVPTAVAEAQRATALARSVTERLDTSAAAYAETGDFNRAIATQHEAIAALRADEAPLRGELERHLESYANHRPWRE